MILEIDFNSDEAIYVQLRNQIIMGIACAEFADGESTACTGTWSEYAHGK